jgi:hypothetical protein
VLATLAALDERVKVGVSSCYVTPFRELLLGGDPQEGEQSFPGFLARGLDLPDSVEKAAPRRRCASSGPSRATATGWSG